MGHFGKCHNTFCLSPQILHKHCFRVLGPTIRENKNNAYANFWGTSKEYYGIFRSGLNQLCDLITKLRRAKGAQRSTMGTIFWVMYRCEKFWLWRHVRPIVQTVGVEVGRQDSFWGRECSGNFPWQEIAWQRYISNPRFSGRMSC